MAIDYKQLGFKCGLEIHQQIQGKKLFCNCPTTNSNAPIDFHFERRLRAVAGETGEIDIAAKYEMEKSKKYIYEGDGEEYSFISSRLHHNYTKRILLTFDDITIEELVNCLGDELENADYHSLIGMYDALRRIMDYTLTELQIKEVFWNILEEDGLF